MNKYIEPPENLNEIITLYQQEGSTLSSVEKETGYARNSLKKWFTNNGITIKTLKEASTQANRKHMIIPDKNQFLSNYEIMSLKQLQEYYNAGQETIYEWINYHNINQISHGERVSFGKTQSFINSIPNIENLENEYKKLGFNKSAINEKFNLSRKQSDILFEQYNIKTVTPWRSTTEIMIFNTISEFDPEGEWSSSRKDIISPFELDIYSEKRNIAVEYCGLYWHSENTGKKTSEYHKEKMIQCKNKGIKLITIFETDNIQNILSMIKKMVGKSIKISARETIVELSDKTTVSNHENMFHIAGSSPASVFYTLKHKKTGNILSTMSFSKPRFSKKYQWEIVRYTVKENVNVIGGAAKLFNQFEKDKNPSSVVSYADLRFGTGEVYGHFGFQLSHISSPNYWYFTPKNLKLRHRAGFQKHTLSTRLSIFDVNLTEWVNMKNNGYDRIWDCGNAVYVWTK
jgi:hypothetical protein